MFEIEQLHKVFIMKKNCLSGTYINGMTVDSINLSFVKSMVKPKKRERTYSRSSDGSVRAVVEHCVGDTLTRGLLAMVLITSMMIFFIPVSAHTLGVEIADKLFTILTIALLPGYFVVMGMLVARCKTLLRPSQQTTVSLAVVKLRHISFGLQSLLFASLLCSTFIMRQQRDMLDHISEAPSEQAILKAPENERSDATFLPLLRQYLSI